MIRRHLPNPAFTPGEVAPVHPSAIFVVSEALAAAAGLVGRVSLGTRCRVYARYGIPVVRRGGYRIDHLIPVGLGGSHGERNLWPQPKDEARLKAVDESHLTAEVASGRLSFKQAQAEMLRLWR